ncbi:hypothetical protein DPEC_G00155720 [Dallia pectoralis]|uniref:Uncharacterized protein n=1 Tax=Dallia pectoralis TaxID=75939 RepID=A0ACC2GKF7_DALPE|nr:hypothetical protein DPEC_G00155720 [Dallia pectoralis]
MANYCARFIKDFASISAPLRELTKKDTPWHWNPEHARALQTIKDSLTSNTVMSYFDPAKDTELEEALAIVWSCEHFHLYLYGNPFILVTDHKALEVIWNNPRSKPPARIERWGLRLQPYNFKVEYRKGADNPADYISRHPIPMQTSESTRAVKVAEEYVNFVAEYATPKAMTLNEIKDETLKDPILEEVSTHIRDNTWHRITGDTQHAATLKKYKQVSEELTVSHTDDIIL